MKGRFKTKVDAETAYEHVYKSETLLLLGINSLVREKPTATEQVKLADGGRYLLRLYRPLEAHGGIVVSTFSCKGQLSSTTVEYFEERWQNRHNATAYTLPLYQAIERLVVVRNKLLSMQTYADLHPDNIIPELDIISQEKTS